MADPASDEDRVSKEAHQRVVTERDQLKAKNDELARTVSDLGRNGKIRSALKGKVSDPDYVADMMLPHLRDVEIDKLEETLGSDRFKPMVAAFATSSGEGDGDGAGKAPEKDPPADPGSGFAGPGPNPGSGGNPPAAKQPVAHDSPEIRALIETGNHAQVEEMYKAGLVLEPQRKY